MTDSQPSHGNERKSDMSWKNLGMAAVIFATALLASGCNPIDPLGLSSNAVADYEWTDGNFGIDSDAMVAVAVVDRRDYVLNGERPPKYTGLVRDGFGIPFDAVTRSQRSLAEDFAISIVAGLRGAGIKAEAPEHSPSRSLEQLRKDLMRANADRYVLLILNQWKTDTYQSTALYYALELTIYGRDGVERMRKDFAGKDEGRSVALTPKGRNAEMVGQLYPARLKKIFEDEKVVAALQFTGQPVSPRAGDTPSVGTSPETPSAVAEYDGPLFLKGQGFKRLNSSEIQSSFSGNTLIARVVGSTNNFTVYFETDGTMRGMSVTPSGNIQRDEGQWKATENHMFCDNWQKWRPGSDCDRIYRRRDEFVYVNVDGTKSSSGTIVQGNPKGL
jgi:hypothetical protein